VNPTTGVGFLEFLRRDDMYYALDHMDNLEWHGYRLRVTRSYEYVIVLARSFYLFSFLSFFNC
jgi:RNA recognition motif-containing protein